MISLPDTVVIKVIDEQGRLVSAEEIYAYDYRSVPWQARGCRKSLPLIFVEHWIFGGNLLFLVDEWYRPHVRVAKERERKEWEPEDFLRSALVSFNFPQSNEAVPFSHSEEVSFLLSLDSAQWKEQEKGKWDALLPLYSLLWLSLSTRCPLINILTVWTFSPSLLCSRGKRGDFQREREAGDSDLLAHYLRKSMDVSARHSRWFDELDWHSTWNRSNVSPRSWLYPIRAMDTRRAEGRWESNQSCTDSTSHIIGASFDLIVQTMLIFVPKWGITDQKNVEDNAWIKMIVFE